MSIIQVEYSLDLWDWQGVTRSVEIDTEDYSDMSAGDIKTAVYAEIRRDAEQNLHLIYNEGDVTEEILVAINTEGEEE